MSDDDRQLSIEEARHQVGTSMMAWRVHEFGPSETMRFERVPVPTPGHGEVLVKVHAAGVGPWDGWIRGGRSALPQPLPLTLGSDLSGEIEALGPDVAGMRIGDQVYGVTNSALYRRLRRIRFGFRRNDCKEAGLAQLH